MNRYTFQNCYGTNVEVAITNGIFHLPAGGSVRLDALDASELAGGVQLRQDTNVLATLDFSSMPSQECTIIISEDPSGGAAFRFSLGDVSAVWIWYVSGIALGMGLFFFSLKLTALKKLLSVTESKG